MNLHNCVLFWSWITNTCTTRWGFQHKMNDNPLPYNALTCQALLVSMLEILAFFSHNILRHSKHSSTYHSGPTSDVLFLSIKFLKQNWNESTRGNMTFHIVNTQISVEQVSHLLFLKNKSRTKENWIRGKFKKQTSNGIWRISSYK